MELLFNNLDKLLDAPNGIKKARQLILQLAVQGKLVEQDPNDEPASELLKRIKKEKEKPCPERSEGSGKKNKKQPARRGGKELPPIKDEEKPFELPKGWEWGRLGEIFEIFDGKRIPVNKAERAKRIAGKEIKDIFPYYGATGQVGWIDSYLFDEKLILLGEDGAPFLESTKPKSYIIEGKTWVNNHAHVLKLILGEESFYKYHLDTIDYTNLVQGMTRLKLNQSKMILIVCPLPPLNEQKRIVEKVNSLMALLDEIEKKRERRNQKRIKLNNASLNKLLTSKDDKELKTNWKRIEENFSTHYSVPENVAKLKQAILQLAVQGKLVPQDPNDEPANELLKKIKKEKEKLIRQKKMKWKHKLHLKAEKNPPFTVPSGWNWVRLNDVVWCYRGHNPPKSEFIKEPKDGYVRFIQITDFKTDDKAVYVPDSPKLKKVFNDEIIMAAYRHIGKLSRKMEGAFNVALCKVNNIEPFNRDYLELLIGSDLIKGKLLKESSRAHIPSMHTDHLLSLWVPIPPMKEQKRILKKINELMSLCNTLEEKLKKIEEKGERLVGAVVNVVTTN